jgi:hypothetical protein
VEFEPGNTFDGLHRTATVDYVICLSGEIDTFLDERKSCISTAGMCSFSGGIPHAWVNR